MDFWEQKAALTLRIAFFLSLSLVFYGCQPQPEALPYYNSPSFTPLFFANIGQAQSKVKHQIADFSFKNQNNQAVTQHHIEGKIHVANFFFTSCSSICPVMTRNMQKIDSVYKEDDNVVLLSFSVTPWIDDVSVLKNYAQQHQINNKNWHLLTGNKAEIYKLARQSYFAEEDLGFTKDSANFLHTEHFLLVDKSKRIRGIYNGTLDLEIMQLIKDIATLRKEK